jgi:TolA-binding protein
VRRIRGAWLGLPLIWLALAAAAQPAPSELPPPDLAPLVPLAAAPLDKPAVVVPELSPPPVPRTPPPVPPLRLLIDLGAKPTATLPTPRFLACNPVGSMFRVASELLECGRARYARSEYEEAARILEQAIRAAGSDKALAREARYWLAEALYRLDRIADADRLYAAVIRDSARDELEVVSVYSTGWTALRLGDWPRALLAFDTMLAQATPGPLSVSGRHGRGLALYSLARYDDARQNWEALLPRGLGAALDRDIRLWLGDSLRRLGDTAAAEQQLKRFTAAGAPHPQLGSGFTLLGWTMYDGGRPAESSQAFRSALATPGQFPDRDWAHLGLALSLIAAGDGAAAREAIRPLEDRSPEFALPALLTLARAASADADRSGAHALHQRLLARNLPASERAWVLFMDADAFRAEKALDDARTQYGLALRGDPTSQLGQLAAFRLAHMNFELREFGQALTDLRALLAQPLPPELRGPALLLAGEAAYYGRDYEAAAAMFGSFVGEFPTDASTPAARFSQGWAELKRGREAEARRIFSDFARDLAGDQVAPEALLLASELAAAAGDSAAALQGFDVVIRQYPNHRTSDLARLNGAILRLRTERVAAAQPELRAFLQRAPDSPLVGRARVALGVVLLAAGQPSEASREFAAGADAGEGLLAQLGIATAALASRQRDEAARAFAEVRDSGPPALVEAAEYGLTVLAFEQGRRDDFKKLAAAQLSSGRVTPALLYVLGGVLIEDKNWTEAAAITTRLLESYPADARTDDALARLGLAAAADKRWLVSRDALMTLRQRYPQSPLIDTTLIPAMETLIEMGDPVSALEPLERLATAAPDDPRLPRAYVLLARAREAVGDRAGALEAYSRAARASRGSGLGTEVLLAHGRLLVTDKRWETARVVLDTVIKGDEKKAATEAAFYKGETYRGEGDQLAAAEYYMTAAYLSPDSLFGQRGLLAAADGFAALKDAESASTLYKKLLAQSNVPADLAASARAGLAALGRN